MKNIKIGELVKYTGKRGHLGIGVVTGIRSTPAINANRVAYDVLWSCGRHSAHTTQVVERLEGA